MIATLEGVLEQRGSDSVIVNVGGIGFQVYVPGSVLNQPGTIDHKVLLHTYLHTGGDNIALYGFISSEELDLFKSLISISGVGPRVALALLSALNAEQVVMAIASENTELISQVPGIGKRIANRIVLELKGKVDKGWTRQGLSISQEDGDVVAALTSLGWSLREATRAVSSIPGAQDLDIEEKVKLALQQLSEG